MQSTLKAGSRFIKKIPSGGPMSPQIVHPRDARPNRQEQ